MTTIEIHCVPRQQLSHNGRYPVLAALKKNMNMVAHENPGIDCAFPFVDCLSNSFKKLSFVQIVFEYV